MTTKKGNTAAKEGRREMEKLQLPAAFVVRSIICQSRNCRHRTTTTPQLRCRTRRRMRSANLWSIVLPIDLCNFFNWGERVRDNSPFLFQPVFSIKEVCGLVRESIDVILMDAHYNKDRVTSWTNKVTEQTLVALTKLQLPYKYIGKSANLQWQC